MAVWLTNKMDTLGSIPRTWKKGGGKGGRQTGKQAGGRIEEERTGFREI